MHRPPRPSPSNRNDRVRDDATPDAECLNLGPISGAIDGLPAVSFRPGMMLTPSVELLRPLGDGGMASVWVGRHKNLGVNVAVKLLNQAMRALPAVRDRFLEEGPAAARIKSPHVIHVFDRGITDDGVP